MDNSARVVLLVEDGEDDVFLLKHSFKEAKIANPVRVAKDCAEAMRYLGGEGEFADRSKHPLPVLVLLDLKLPDRSGLELLQWVRRVNIKSVPIIVFTSSSNINDVKAAYEAGAASYVVKPLTVEERQRFATLVKDYWIGYNVFPG
ncbi:MAG TPA: response regulator [Verrucomicrobiae bacterium]|jgi:DNA-binding response OmpR family regulator